MHILLLIGYVERAPRDAEPFLYCCRMSPAAFFRGVYSSCPVRSVDVPGLVGLHNHVAEAGVSLGGLDFGGLAVNFLIVD